MKKRFTFIAICCLLQIGSYAQTVTCSSTGILCYGQCTGTITANVLGGTSPYQYSIDGGITFQANNPTFTNLCAGNYTILVKDAVNSTATCTSNISQPPSLLCTAASTGNSATVNVSGGTPAYTYSWSNGQTNNAAFGLSAGTHSVTVVDANGCTCTSVVNVCTLPVSGSTAICIGQSTTLCASGATNYLWSTGSTAACITVSPFATTTYTVSNGAGCTSSVTVFVVPMPVVTVSGNTTICVGQSTVLLAAGAISYSWSPSAGLSNTNISNPVASPTATTTYMVIGSNANGCVDTVTLNVYVSPGPCPLSVTCTHTNALCNGSNGSACVTASGGTGPYTYLWSTTPPQNTSCATGLIAGTYTVLVVDALGATAICTSAILNVPALTCAITTSGNSATVNVAGGTAPYTYVWNNGQTNQTAFGLVTGTYSVVVADANGCTCMSSVTISPVPCSLTLTLKKDTINPLVWYAYPFVTGTAPFSYFWDFGDGNTSTQVAPTHTYAIVGNYKICLTITDANGCISTSCDTTYKVVSPNSIQILVVVNTTGIEENTVSVNSIFPNPANDNIEISFSDFVKGELRIMDITGREVYREAISANTVKVNVAALPIGFYNLTVLSGSKTMHEKIMIAR